MRKPSDESVALYALIFFVFWLFVVLPFLYGQHDECPAEESKYHGFWQKTICDPIAVFTAVLALSTIGLWIVTGFGIRVQARDTRILQRAYLSVVPLGLHPFRLDNRIGCNIGIKNSGNLPAREVSWVIHRC